MSLLKKTVNVFLAVLLLGATTGVTLNKHYCMGRLISVAINTSASPCTENGEAMQMPCCEDISEELKIEEITTVAFDFDSQPELYLLSVVLFASAELELASESAEHNRFQDYAPPPLSRDIPVLNQTFLI